MSEQTTLQGSVEFAGIGLHSGTASAVRIQPAEANHGLVFLCKGVRIPALAEYVTETARGTTLGEKGVWIKTVEHCLSTLRGFGVDNALIEVEGEELPALDGAAYEYSRVIEKIGVQDIKGSQKLRWMYEGEPLDWKEGRSRFRLMPSARFQAKATLDYPNTLITDQSAEFQKGDSYQEEISKARTFCMEEEIVQLRTAGLAKGGSLDNAIVLGKTGVKAQGGLRYPNEFARHKLLDLIGDLALIGSGEFYFRVEAVAPGHKANTAFARFLRGKLIPK